MKNNKHSKYPHITLEGVPKQKNKKKITSIYTENIATITTEIS